MARLGVAPHVIERVLNHVSGSRVLAGIYNRYGYLPEKRKAPAKSSQYVERLIGPRTKFARTLRSAGQSEV
jgi:hypothetical protein